MTTNELAIRPAQSFETPGPMSYPEMLKVGEALCAAGWFKDVKNAGQAAVKIMLGQELGVSPLTAMRGIFVLETSRGPVITLAADLCAKLMKAHGYEWTVDRLDTTGCELTIRHGNRELGKVAFTQDHARKAGLLDKTGPWKQFPEDQYFAKAILRGQRRFAPEVTGGLPIPVVDTEDLSNEPVDTHDDSFRALHAKYREIYPKNPDYDDTSDRLRRLWWSSKILGRDIESWTDLTVADVRKLHNALDEAMPQAEMFAPDQTGSEATDAAARANEPVYRSAGERDSTTPKDSSGPPKGHYERVGHPSEPAAPAGVVGAPEEGEASGMAGAATQNVTGTAAPAKAPARRRKPPVDLKAEMTKATDDRARFTGKTAEPVEHKPTRWSHTLPAEWRVKLQDAASHWMQPWRHIEDVMDRHGAALEKSLDHWTDDMEWTEGQLEALLADVKETQA